MRLERLPLSSTQALSKSNPSDFRPTCAVVGENDAPAFVPVNDDRKTSQVAQCQKQLLFLRSGRPSVRPPPNQSVRQERPKRVQSPGATLSASNRAPRCRHTRGGRWSGSLTPQLVHPQGT